MDCCRRSIIHIHKKNSALNAWWKSHSYVCVQQRQLVLWEDPADHTLRAVWLWYGEGKCHCTLLQISRKMNSLYTYSSYIHQNIQKPANEVFGGRRREVMYKNTKEPVRFSFLWYEWQRPAADTLRINRRLFCVQRNVVHRAGLLSSWTIAINRVTY